MKNCLAILFLSLAVVDAGASDRVEQLDRLYGEFWEENLRMNPLQATFAGDPRYNGDLPNYLSVEFLEQNRAFQQKYLDRFVRTHRESFERRFPMLPGVEFEYTWGGSLALSRNHMGHFGQLAPNVYGALCCNGLGVTRGTVTGTLRTSVVAKMNFTCSGGSSSVLSRPLKAGFDSMCTSSRM